MSDTLQLVGQVPSNSTCQKRVNQVSDTLQLVGQVPSNSTCQKRVNECPICFSLSSTSQTLNSTETAQRMSDMLQLVGQATSNSTCQKCVNQVSDTLQLVVDVPNSQLMSDMLQLVVVIIDTQLTRSAQSGRAASGRCNQCAVTTTSAPPLGLRFDRTQSTRIESRHEQSRYP